VSFIGSLEQFDLANILRRLEAFTKTGLLVVRQAEIWVEFYFRQGQLVCVGPMRANTTLIDRLLQANLLVQQALPRVRALVDPSESNETRIALALINGGYLSREVLRAWSSHETSQILRALLGWPGGDIYFEEEQATPPDRLLVALSISALLDALPAANPTPSQAPMGMPAPGAQLRTQEPAMRPTLPASAAVDAGGLLSAVSRSFVQTPERAAAVDSGERAGLLNASQLIDDLPFNLASATHTDQPGETPPSLTQVAPASISFGAELDISAPKQVSLLPPRPVPHPLPPARIDTAFMTPDLVLVPVDLSSLRERNPQVQLTPDQWRLFALVDGQASLQMLCQALMASAEQVRAVAGELMAIGLVMPLSAGSFNEMPAPVAPAVTPDIAVAAPRPYAGGPPSWSAQPAGPAPFTPPVASGRPVVVGGNWMFSAPQAAPQPAYAQPGVAYASMGGY
jgi:hypothetical protein